MEGTGRNFKWKKVEDSCTDNRGEYTSAEFTIYLKKEGIRHEWLKLSRMVWQKDLS